LLIETTFNNFLFYMVILRNYILGLTE